MNADMPVGGVGRGHKMKVILQLSALCMQVRTYSDILSTSSITIKLAISSPSLQEVIYIVFRGGQITA